VRHEETGLLVPPRDPDALAAAICRLLDSPDEARRFAQAGRRLMLDRHTIEHTVAAIDDLYQGRHTRVERGFDADRVAAQEAS
jgi:glycosyltransferase involved in cell wall biosynthesis